MNDPKSLILWALKTMMLADIKGSHSSSGVSSQRHNTCEC
jgi:hypothetical protein